jgi:hypothetical protein
VSHWCDLSYTIEVPRDTDVRVESDNAGMEVHGIDGDLDLENDSGPIVGTDLRSRVAMARNDDARVELEFLDPPDRVSVENDTGRISLVVPDIDEGYAVETQNDEGSTDVVVRTDPDSPHAISVDNDTGRIEIDNP